MGKQFLCLLSSILLFQAAFPQKSIRGKVVIEATGKPLASVSVYLNNTSKGTVTDEQGMFRIGNVPEGKFRLVASYVGYETYVKIVDTRNLPEEIVLPLKPRAIDLKGIDVKLPDPLGWTKWGKLFSDIFIGTSANSIRCELQNPEALKFRLGEDNRLIVYANEPIRITNDALGYEISYKLEEFEYDFSTKTIIYNGYAFFRDLALTHSRKAAKWEANRKNTYQGSLLHFMRTFFVNKLDAEGFEMRSLGKISNPEKDRAKEMFRLHKDSIIVDTTNSKEEFLFDQFGTPTAVSKSMSSRDSTAYFRKALKLPDSVISHQPVIADSLGFAADSSTAGLYFRDSLEVSYTLKGIPDKYRRLSKKHLKETYPVSQFVFVNKRPVFVLSNGYYYGPYDLKITGFWAWWETMSTLLPYDYSGCCQPDKP